MIKIVYIVPLVIVSLMDGQLAHATNLTPYKAGYTHGVGDANGNSALYIEQPGKGPDFHTKQFNQGYVDGFCSVAGPGGASGLHLEFSFYFYRIYTS
jgi:hypothetical protein